MIVRALLVAGFAVALDPAVVREIEEFRAKHEEDYRRVRVPAGEKAYPHPPTP